MNRQDINATDTKAVSLFSDTMQRKRYLFSLVMILLMIGVAHHRYVDSRQAGVENKTVANVAFNDAWCLCRGTYCALFTFAFGS